MFLFQMLRILFTTIIRFVFPAIFTAEYYNPDHLITWENIKADPLGFGLFFLLTWGVWEVIMWLIEYIYATIAARQMVSLRVSLPRNDSKMDKDNQTKKDFKEKVGIMQQLYRAIYEIRDLSISNMLRAFFLKQDRISFEYYLNNQELYFYVQVFPYYRSIIEKQITSFYPDAEIAEDKYHFFEKGYRIKAFYLKPKREYWYPIGRYKEMDDDPLNVLANSFSKSMPTDRAVVQIVIRPESDRWRKKAQREGTDLFKNKKKGWFKGIPGLGWLGTLFSLLVQGATDENIRNMTNAPGASSGDSYIRMLQPLEEAYKRVGEKAGQSGFKCNIRVLTLSKESKSQAEDLMNNIVVAFNVFKDAYCNWFENWRILPLDFISTPLIYFSYTKRFMGFFQRKCLLTPEELASIYHFPDSIYNKIPIIHWMQYKVLAPPVDLPKEGILLGYNMYRSQKTEVRFLREDRTRHHYVIGKSGTGKSAFLSYIARQDVQNGEGVCVVDPHGDLIEDVLCYVPKSRAKEVVVFDPSNKERPMAMNILEAHTPEEMDRASLDATSIFIKMYGDEIFGPRIQHYFRNACLSLMEDQDEGATLIDVPRIFTDESFLKYKLTKVKNSVVRSFWEHEYANTGDREKQEMIPYFSAKFGPFITNTTMRNIIGQSKSSFNIREIMDHQQVLLVNLSKGKIGDLNAQLLGLIFVNKISMAAMMRADMAEAERKDFFLYVDEFQNFATDTFATILSEARKYRLNLIMAHQYIAQLTVTPTGHEDKRIRDAVFGNVGTMMSFKVGAEDAEYLVKEYAPVLSEQDIIGIANYKAYLKLNIHNTTSRPFSLETVFDKKGKNEKLATIIKRYSSLKYGRKREFVDQEIEDRLGIK